MRVVLIAAVSVLAAAVAVSAADKAPKAIDIKKTLDEKCGGSPFGVVDLDGKHASKAQLEEAKFQVTSFITQSDVYQDCILKLAEALGPNLTDVHKRYLGLALKQNQDEKEAVGAAFNTAICEYNAANKIPDSDCKDGKWIVKTVEQTDGKPAAAKPAAAKPATATATTPATKPKTP